MSLHPQPPQPSSRSTPGSSAGARLCPCCLGLLRIAAFARHCSWGRAARNSKPSCQARNKIRDMPRRGKDDNGLIQSDVDMLVWTVSWQRNCSSSISGSRAHQATGRDRACLGLRFKWRWVTETESAGELTRSGLVLVTGNNTVLQTQLGYCCPEGLWWDQVRLCQPWDKWLWHPLALWAAPSLQVTAGITAATVHSPDDSAFALTWLTMHCNHLRHRHTFSPPYFMPPFATLVWGHWQRDGANNWGARSVLEDLIHCTWVIMLNPAQARRTEERNETHKRRFLLAVGVRLHRFILRHLFLMVFCKSPTAVLWRSLKKYYQTSRSHSQLHSLPALTSPVVGRLHQWRRFSGNYVSQPSSFYSYVVLHLISADVVYERFSWELSIDTFACSFHF